VKRAPRESEKMIYLNGRNGGGGGAGVCITVGIK